MDFREIIARRGALELTDGAIVNLGFGMPTAIANFIPKGIDVVLQSENGCLYMGPTPKLGQHSSDKGNAGGQPISLMTGASIFDIATSFSIIRGGHVDVTILGALEVDQHGDIANWAMPLAPGKYAPGMGGAMDLVVGARNVVAILQHNNKKGESKILKKCALPITGKGVVNTIITEKAVFKLTPKGLQLTEIAKGMSVDDIRACTEAEFFVDNPIEYQLA